MPAEQLLPARLFTALPVKQTALAPPAPLLAHVTTRQQLAARLRTLASILILKLTAEHFHALLGVLATRRLDLELCSTRLTRQIAAMLDTLVTALVEHFLARMCAEFAHRLRIAPHFHRMSALFDKLVHFDRAAGLAVGLTHVPALFLTLVSAGHVGVAHLAALVLGVVRVEVVALHGADVAAFEFEIAWN
jgi:hypothetical protein